MTSPTPTAKHTAPHQVPNRLYVLVSGVTVDDCSHMAHWAAEKAKSDAPKLSGSAADSIAPWYGEGFFGMTWDASYLWYQERGTRGRVMKELAGKVIPMWIDDPTGKEKLANPKAKTRITKSGRTQVLIFRKAAKIGAKKMVKRRVAGRMQSVSVPASYPGAPGRIGKRQWKNFPDPSSGKIAKGNIGLRWYHPGLTRRDFMHHAIHMACLDAGLGQPPIYAINGK